MKSLKLLSAIFVGLLFIFSGTIKAIDPYGTIYKLQDYFQAFGIGFMKPLALFLTILLCTSEFIAGFTVLFNFRSTKGIWLVIILMAFFTPLTFILALTNPVSDCGCFGDAIKLTNWQTFFKNIIILIPSVYLFIKRDKEVPVNRLKEFSITSAAAFLFILFIFFNKRYLPVIDFMPYKTGTNIPSKMVIPEGAKVDTYETTFIYEKSGVKKEFTLSDYPAGDTTWKFIEQKSVLVSKGYQPPIHDFQITSVTDNIDITDSILKSGGYTMLMISNKLEEADFKHLERGYNFGESLCAHGFNFYIVTSSGSEYIKSVDKGFHYCQADEVTLKSMVRANPGYMLLKKGNILGKWSWANVPDIEKLNKIIDNNN